MIGRPLRWHHRARFFFSHHLAHPLQSLFVRIPRCEFGHQTIEVSRLACQHAPLAGRRAVQLSDLHLDLYQPRHDRVVALIKELRPDWIFITGDLLTVPQGLPHLVRFLGHLRALAPVFMTLGNHDHYSRVPVDRFMEMADRQNVHLLVNQSLVVPTNQGELGVVGVDDPSLHRADLHCIPSDVPDRFTVLLAHAPNVLDHLDERHAVDLILCGHSHGGQVRIPFLKPFWLPYGCSGRLNGQYHRNGHRLYVNRGLGWSVLPTRWNCPPEILLIEWLS